MSRPIYAALVWAVMLAILAMAVTVEPVRAQPAPTPPLTLADAFTRALENHPSLQAAAEAQQAAAAGVRQADRFPNPTLDFLIEHAAGSGPYQAVDRAETTLALQQPIELGGDRRARRDVAARELNAANLGGYIRRLDLLRDVELSFVDAQAAVATLAVALQRLEVARDLADAVEHRVRAARDPLMARSRAQARLAEAQAETETTQRLAAAARARLASFWGGANDFRIEADSLERMAAEPGTSAAPDVAQLEIERERADAGIALEQARAVPDVTVSAGVRQYQADDAYAALLGISVPLLVFNRNTDAISRARADRARAVHEVDVGRQAIEREKAYLTAQIDAARIEVEALQADVIPLGEEALLRARDGYAKGAFSYLDVFEAQRALFDARLRRVAALQSFRRAHAMLSRLSGAHAEFQPANSQPVGEATR